MNKVKAFSGSPARVEKDINAWMGRSEVSVVSVNSVAQTVSAPGNSSFPADGNILVLITYTEKDIQND